MKNILGLDLGTNSIGWSVIQQNDDNEPTKILGLGSRIIPMSQDIIGAFESGNSKSQTADRTTFRGTRRLRERFLLRRERLHRVLHIMGFLPEHYESNIDFEKRLGKFNNDTEPKIAWIKSQDGFSFIFKKSFEEMMADFSVNQPDFTTNGKKVPYDWTLYFLRKKALSQKISKEEIAWILLNFNQKRGYYQLRGEEDENETQNKTIEYHALNVIKVTIDEDSNKGKEEKWYDLQLENGWIYRRSSKSSLSDWVGKTKEFIVTTEFNSDETVKKRTFRSPSDEDWTLLKKKTESDIENSHKTVGSYIYDTLLENPNQKIKGKLIRTIERKFYRQELEIILTKQKEFHIELTDNELLRKCIHELYPNNEAHANTRINKDFNELFVKDIILYQRPLKSKKSLISDCPFEKRVFMKDGIRHEDPIKCISKSHPLFQEFRLWQFVKNLKIYAKEKYVENRLQTEVDVTSEFLKTEEDYVSIFSWLNERKDIKQESLLTSYFKIKKPKGQNEHNYRWNYVQDKEYPCNQTHAAFRTRLAKLEGASDAILTKPDEIELWHILYSVKDKIEIEKALHQFAKKKMLGDAFVDAFRKIPPFENDYGSYSEKAIKKLLPLMRMGSLWNQNNIDKATLVRISKIIDGEFDEDILLRVREKSIQLTKETDFKGLPLWLASYVAYNRHSESGETEKWEKPEDIDAFLKEFKQHSLRNPIVEQVLTETLRVVRDIWRKFETISEIHIELGRDLKSTSDQRKSITEKNLKNEDSNSRIKALLDEMFNSNIIENVRPYSPSQQEILKLYEEGVLNSVAEIPDDVQKIVKQRTPSANELTRYRLWLDQKYRSPYTGRMIPLSKLFTSSYEIEHIIPQARYFDDSLSNKVICESEVNREKEDKTAYEFIKNNPGRIIELNFGEKVEVFQLEAYENHVKEFFSKNKGKLNRLLMDEIPDDFINRQLNDTRYISKVVKTLLSNIVREKDEMEATSKNVVSCNGTITSRLKQDWGLNDVWNTLMAPRYERLNLLTNSNKFGSWENKSGKRAFQITIPKDLQKGFSKKRIDHRHHAMDALVIASATRNHINYLNNEHAHKKDSSTRYDLRNLLRRQEEIEIERVVNGERVRKRIKVAKEFFKPWASFTKDTQIALENIVVSFKQNVRVINKTVNRHQHYVNGVKVVEKQTKGDSWAIRKSLHKGTVAGQVNLKLRKTVTFSAAIDTVNMITDKNLKLRIKQLIAEGLDKKKILKYFSDGNNIFNESDVSRVEIYYFSNDVEPLVASRVPLDSSFDFKKIESITDTGIQLILKKHLENYDGNSESAFSPEGIVDMNSNIIALNNGKSHQPILRVRTYETLGNKFNVGINGNKRMKFVEADKGTNLFFAIYQDETGKRSYESVPLNIVVENLKQNLPAVSETKIGKNEQLLKLNFSLSPNDLVYVPTQEEIESNSTINLKSLGTSHLNRIYKMVSASGSQCFFVHHHIASPIANKNGINEFSSLNKMERSIDGIMIKEFCQKVVVNRLGEI
jgi:CRISPR-associated endonuclease Csn1